MMNYTILILKYMRFEGKMIILRFAKAIGAALNLIIVERKMQTGFNGAIRVHGLHVLG